MLTPADIHLDMNYCRRCGSKFSGHTDHVYSCPNGHTIYANASPAVAAIILNPVGEVLVAKRGINPGKGLYDLPGGFCDGAESFEDAIRREIEEEVGINPSQYGSVTYLNSGIDAYDLAGEVLPVASCVFIVQLHQATVPEPHDDVAESFFVPLDKIEPDKFYFPTLQTALKIFINHVDGVE